MPDTFCLLCGDRPIKIIATRGIISKGGSTLPVRNVICTGCGLVFQSPQPRAEDLAIQARSYTEERHGFASPDELRKYISGVSWKNKGQALGSFLSEFITPATKVLDLGCGPGVVIKYLRENFSCLVLGVEPSKVAADFARSEYGLPVYGGTLDDFLRSDGVAEFGVIILHHVFEHLPDPVASLRALRRRMTKDGVLYVEVPDVSSFSKPVDHFFDAMHLWSFTPATLRATLSRGGFKIIRWNRAKRYRIQVVAAADGDSRNEIPEEEYPTISADEIIRSLRTKRLRDKTLGVARTLVHFRSRH